MTEACRTAIHHMTRSLEIDTSVGDDQRLVETDPRIEPVATDDMTVEGAQLVQDLVQLMLATDAIGTPYGRQINAAQMAHQSDKAANRMLQTLRQFEVRDTAKRYRHRPNADAFAAYLRDASSVFEDHFGRNEWSS